MEKYDYNKLQNGSDIRGVALYGVPGEEVNLNAEATSRIAKAFAFWLTNQTGKQTSDLTIAVGRDSRLSGLDLSKVFCDTLASYGITVLYGSLASTPAMFMSTLFQEYQTDGAVMITASHLPFNRNGFKFFDKNGGLEKGDITDIITFAESDSILGRLIPNPTSTRMSIPLLDTYAAHLRQMIMDETNQEKPLEGMHILVDAGNGAGGFFASKVLQPLGADTSGSQFLDPDGTFPNHPPNPEDKEAMASICRAVKNNKADLGIIFDTDVDRSSAVDENGHEISRNGIVAMAAALIADKYPGTTVVTDSITSTQLTEFLEGSLGVKHLRYKRGYKNVINKSKELNQAGTCSQLAIETSGHAAYKENYFLDDGAYLATKIVIKAALLHKEGLKISSVLADLAEPAESTEVRIPIKGDDFAAYGDMVLSKLEEYFQNKGASIGASIVKPNYEGVRVSFSGKISGWFLLRKSLHDPIMPLNIESDTLGGCKKISKIVKAVLKEFPNLDLSL